MDDANTGDAAERYAVVGEDTPRWLTFTFALLGLAIAAAAIWLWLARQPQTVATVEPAPPAVEAPVAAPPVVPQPEPEVAGVSGIDIPEAAPTETLAEAAEALPETPAVAESVPAPIPPTPEAPADASGEAAIVETQVTGEVARDPDTAAAAPGDAADRFIQRDIEGEPCPEDAIVRFAFGSATPPPDAAGLARLVGWLQTHPDVKVSVQGHADAIGTDPYNLVLSYQRAQAVAALLNDAGVVPDRVIVGAAGSHEPVAGVPANARENRRVVVQVMNVGDCRPTVR